MRLKRLPLFLAVLALALAAVFPLAPRVIADWSGGHDVAGCPEAGTSWYFAEGNTRSGFDEWICLQNPGEVTAEVTALYMLAAGENVKRTYSLPPNSRTTVKVSGEVPPGNDVSVKIDSTKPVVAERPIYFRYRETLVGGHDVVGATAPSEEWYFAEGTCRPGFDTFLCIANPGKNDANVEITYMLGDGTTTEQKITVGGESRSTVTVADTLGRADDASHDFSCRVRAMGGASVVAERPMYFDFLGRNGGHDVVGANAPSEEWYFAEGTCRPGFEPFLCLQNPGEKSASVRVTYMLGDGSAREQEVDVAAHSRVTVKASTFLGTADDEAHDFSLSVRSEQGCPVIAERPMYFEYRGRTGGHDVVGVNSPGSEWYFAEGTCRPDFDPYICIQNPDRDPAAVGVDYMLGDGTRALQSLEVPGNSRRTIAVKEFLGEGDDVSHDFSCRVAASAGARIVVERPVYFSYQIAANWSLSAVGDVNLGGDMVPKLQTYGFDYPWAEVGDLLRATNLTFANLECTISYGGEQVQGKAFTFRGPPEGLGPMRDAGVDVVSQANNHARDFGVSALVDSLGYLDAYGIANCGAGVDYESAHRPAYLMANGLRIAFLAYDDIGYSGWWAGAGYPGVAHAADTDRIATDIATAKRDADLVVASFHWGTEKKYSPDQRQFDLAHFAVDCGADLVLGHHPHVAQGFQFYRGKLIAYSLGNFVFNPGSAECCYTILTRFDLDSSGVTNATIYPVHIENGRPRIMSGDEANSLLSRVAGLSADLGTQVSVSDGVATIP